MQGCRCDQDLVADLELADGDGRAGGQQDLRAGRERLPADGAGIRVTLLRVGSGVIGRGSFCGSLKAADRGAKSCL